MSETTQQGNGAVGAASPALTCSAADIAENAERKAFESRLARLNKLAKYIDAWCDAIHPSAWEEHNEKEVARWKRLAKSL